jgi:starch synthase
MESGKMNVLFVVSECAPLIKTGGLADVAGALPGALAREGCPVRVLMPAYPGLEPKLTDSRELLTFDDLFGGPARVVGGQAAGLDLLLLDAPHLYDRVGLIYLGPDGKDWPDNAARFAALSWAGARIGLGELNDGWRADVVHAHDWQAGLTPVYLSAMPGRPATVMTIHNISYQGHAPAWLRDALRLPASGFTPQGFEFWGGINFLKAGVVYADAITTVSPSYAHELMSPDFGMGLEGVIEARAGRLHGILNGIDLDCWDPESDPAVLPFGPRTMARRAANRQALAEEFGIETEGPLFGVVSRLTPQKGLDLLLSSLHDLLDRQAGLVLLGSGDPDLEHAFTGAAHAHPGQVGVRIGYDEPLSHRIYAGSDVIVVPSRFEPCGLTQLYGLRYGALPLVARTGGLADTVIDANDAARKAGAATGFQFQPGSVRALKEAINRACDCFLDNKVWRHMQRNAMKHPVGWETSAASYRALYESLTEAAP